MEKHLNLIGEIVMPLLTLDAVDIEQFDKDNFELKELDEVFEKQHDVANAFSNNCLYGNCTNNNSRR